MDPKDLKRLERSAALLAKRRSAVDQAWQAHKELVKEIYGDGNNGVTLVEIGNATGVTKARVFQMTSGKRSAVKPAVAEPVSEEEEDGLAAAS